MGNTCNSINSVGVIENFDQQNKVSRREEEARTKNLEHQYEDNSKEEENVDLGTFEFNINEWKKLINSLISNKTLEKYSLSKKRTEFNALNELILFLSKAPVSNEFEKAWVLFMWITHNIDYDAESFRTGKFPQQDAGSVLKNGKSVCAGYSSLFKYLSKGINLNCIEINGYAKGFGYTTGIEFKETNHTWNAIQIKEKWYLIDSTWGAGNVDSNFKFQKEFKPFYFSVPSQLLIYTHFPVKQRTQMIKQITQKEFESLPKIDLKFFVLGLGCSSLKSSIIDCSVNPLFIEFESERDTQLTGYLVDEKSKQISDAVFTQRDRKTYKHGLIVIIPEKNKKYTLGLFAKKDEVEDETSKNFVNVGEVVVVRTSDDINKNISNYNIAFDYDIELVSHFSSYIVFTQNPLNLEFSAPLTATGFKVSLRDSGNNLINDCSIYQRSLDKKNIELKLVLPKKNEIYKLELFALSKFIGYLWLKRDQGDPIDEMSFFQIFSGLSDYKAHVFCPHEKNLKRKHSYLFKISAENSTNAALVFLQKEWIYMKNDTNDKIWSIDHTFEQSGSLQLFIMVDNQWKGICGYEIV